VGNNRDVAPVERAQCAAPVERAQSVSSCGRFSTYVLKHIELAAKLLDYFLRINKTNIHQSVVHGNFWQGRDTKTDNG